MTDEHEVRQAFAAAYPQRSAELALGENNQDFRGLKDLAARHAYAAFRRGWDSALDSEARKAHNTEAMRHAAKEER